MKRHSKKSVKLMESYLMLNKNLVTMLVKTLIIQPPVHPIHQMVINFSQLLFDHLLAEFCFQSLVESVPWKVI